MGKINGSANAEAGNVLKPEFVQVIARVCHDANAAYCRSLGDDSQPAWADAPDWQRSSAIMGVEFHIANPKAGDSASHDSWMAQKLAEGWVYGDVKDPEKKTHPCIVPFEQLPPEQQFKDTLFRTLVHVLDEPLSVAAFGIDLMIDEHQAALAKLAKMDAAPKAKSGVAKARKVGPVKDQLSPSGLLELIGAANVVELAFSDGKKELSIPARQISGRAWIVNAVGLKLQLPEFIVEGPDGGAQSLAGYGLFLDGEQVAWAARPDVMEVVPRRKSDLRHDVVFTGN